MVLKNPLKHIIKEFIFNNVNQGNNFDSNVLRSFFEIDDKNVSKIKKLINMNQMLLKYKI